MCIRDSHHVVEHTVGGVVEIVLLHQRYGILHRVGVIQDEPEQGGRGPVGFVGVDVRGSALAIALIGHEDAAGPTGVVDAVQRGIGSGQCQELMPCLLYTSGQDLIGDFQRDAGVGDVDVDDVPFLH